ncbi:MAG TPA: alpha/beta hydrolase [Gemmatimonadaceae bacterium]|jgi:predicted esterase
MTTQDLGHVHRFIPASGDEDVVLLVLHGTGGDENDLIPLANMLRPGAAVLSPRGNVLEHGMPRFFRRLAEGVFDLDDLARRTDELGEFIDGAATQYGIDRSKLIAVGFSNGANVAASLMLRHPGSLSRAALLSPMVPFEPDNKVDLAGTRVFIGGGRNDPIASPQQAERLAQLLRDSGVDVRTYFHNGGHSLTHDELAAVQKWISD